MTEREKQILGWISENPMISQQELAKKANITRSSVAVHISNLIKKGKIKGKGYVISKENYVTVIGGINIDISGTPFNDNIIKDSNPGVIDTKIGGVGRNIAENLVKLGVATELITCFGDDGNADNIYESCKALDISLRHSVKIPQSSTSTYLCINDVGGNMSMAISDMKIYDNITPEFIMKRLNVINNSRVCVLDTNIPKEAINYIAQNSSVPIFADPVSGRKSEKLLDSIGNVHSITPNEIEMFHLTGIEIRCDDDMKKAADYLIKKGVKQVFLTIGKRGVFYSNGIEYGIVPPIDVANVVNTTGAGDSFMAGVVWAYLNNKDTATAAKIGSGMAALTIQSQNHVSENITPKNLIEITGLE